VRAGELRKKYASILLFSFITHHYPMSRLEMSEIFFTPPIHLHGVGRDVVFSRYQKNLKLISVNIGESYIMSMNS